MPTLDENTLAAIGRMTVAATELEHLLAWIAGDPAVCHRPGAALDAARDTVRHSPELVAAIDGAGSRITLSRAALLRLWRDDVPPPGPAVFTDIAAELLRCRDWLHTSAEWPTPEPARTGGA